MNFIKNTIMLPIWLGLFSGCMFYVTIYEKGKSNIETVIMQQAYTEKYVFKNQDLKSKYEDWLKEQIRKGNIND